MGKLNRKRAAEILGVSPLTVLRMIQDGRLPASKNDSGYWEIDSSALERYADEWSAKTEQAALHFQGKQLILNAIGKQIDAQRLRLIAILNNASIAIRDGRHDADTQLQDVQHEIEQYKALRTSLRIVDAAELMSEADDLVTIGWTTEKGDENE